MGRLIDLNQPLSEEDKEYLYSRSRGHQVRQNERRFGVDGTEELDGENAGIEPVNPYFDADVRNAATLDIGGGKLTPDTGREYERDNGVYDKGTEPEPETIDDDISEEVAGYTVPELEEKLKELEVEFDSKDLKEDLQELLANKLQDDRDAAAEAEQTEEESSKE